MSPTGVLLSLVREDGNPGGGGSPPAWNAALGAFQGANGRLG